MKKSLLIAALTLVSASAFASAARLNSLQSAAHLSDVQDIVTKPDTALSYGDALTLEFGSAGTSSAINGASGGFIRHMGDSAMAVYFGNKGTSATTWRNLADSTNLLGTENALNLIYATKMSGMNLGGGLYYSASSRKPDGTTVNTLKTQDASGLYVSARGLDGGKDTWDAQLSLGLSNNAKTNDTATTDKTMAGKTSYKLSGGYWMNTTYLYAYYQNSGATYKSSTATLNDFSNNQMVVGAVDSIKKDGNEFFYGASYKSTTNKDDGTTPAAAISTKTETTSIPLIAGLESDVTSWMTLRGSITQAVLVNSKKVASTTATTTKDDGASNTTVAAGAGFKFGKVMFDGTLNAGTTGNFGTDAAGFLASTSFTYLF